MNDAAAIERESSRIALGTAQFGMAYGVANATGRIHFDDAVRIIDEARASGIDTLDTAVAYGASEEVLGRIGVAGFKVVSKLPALPNQCTDVWGWVCSEVQTSLKRLQVPRLDALLLHQPRDLARAEGDDLSRAMRRLKEEGLIDRIGASLYAPVEIDSIRDKMPLDIVQAPLNPIDWRFLDEQKLAKLKLDGVEVHVRSVFLQGLLLMKDEERPARFDVWNGLWQQWRSWLTLQRVDALSACLHFALSRDEVARVVVGIDSLEQFKQIMRASSTLTRVEVPSELRAHDQQLVNPSLWPVK